MQNEIRREITINADKEKIYAAISDPDKVILWFPETLEGKYQVGQQPIFGFGDHGRNQVYVEDAKPFHYFSYRWVPGASHYLGDVLSVPNTLVEFHIEELAENKCKVTLVESGFASLPAETIEGSFNQNSKGWDFMLGRLEKLFQ
ncbi:MAG: SRPBCC family protein [Bdellovibrionales bacterium]|nr:SRPBCC family protein [Bdellovibrionales bacterium]